MTDELGIERLGQPVPNIRCLDQVSGALQRLIDVTKGVVARVSLPKANLR
jgi:hypothetical protein